LIEADAGASYLLDWNAAFCSCRRAKLLHEQQFHLVTKRIQESPK
jgi:hypothetical protein